MKGRSLAYILTAACLFCLAGCGGTPQHRHTVGYAAPVEPTCTEAGLTGHWACTECGACFSDEAGLVPCEPEVLPALGHNFVREEVKAATCMEEGVLSTVCLRCGIEEESILPETGHLFGAWEQTLAPSCGREGEEARTCAYCGERETRVLPALAEHAFGADNVCTVCAYVCEPTPGLAYTPVLGEDGNLAGYEVSMGEAEAGRIVVAPYHEGEPVVAVAEGGFRECTFLRELALYAPLARIGANAFRGCSGLRTIGLPDSVKEVGEMAFYGCINAVSLRLGSALDRIAPNAFYGLEELESISVIEQNPVYSGEGNCLVEKATGTLLLGSGESVIPEDVKTIADYAFFSNKSLREIVLPAGIGRVGAAAFSGCTRLTSFTYLGTAEAWARVEKGARWKDYAAFDEVIIAG